MFICTRQGLYYLATNKFPLLVSSNGTTALLVQDDFSAILVFSALDVENQVRVGRDVDVTFMVNQPALLLNLFIIGSGLFILDNAN